MDKCRACLATEGNLIPMDVSFLQNFTLLTGLSVSDRNQNKLSQVRKV